MFLLKKNKKYISCDVIEHGMDFFVDSINFCCRIPPDENGYKKLVKNYKGEILNWKDFFAIKRHYRNQMKKGKIIKECQNCIYLQEKEWDNKDYISYINFNNWTVCNESCIYCHLSEHEELRKKQYNVFPVIEDLAKKGYLKSGGHITIAGGEPCMAPEFDDLINLFIKEKMVNIRVLTNATKFSEAVYNGIKEGVVNIVVSVDSGKKETFIKIKKYDFYDKVWENIEKYTSVMKEKNSVKTKFILIPGVNDTEEEIDCWLEKSISCGIKHIAFDVEMMWFDENKNNIPSCVFDITKYLINKAKDKNLNVEFIDRGVIVSNLIEKNYNFS